jgi:hypothetical protein
MGEKRLNKRHGKQISVRFGEVSPDHFGLTLDVSQNGMFLKSNRIYPHQTKVVVSMEVAHGRTIQCEGIVQWAKRVPQAMALVVPKNGMGILLTNAPEEYGTFINQTNGRDSPKKLS